MVQHRPTTKDADYTEYVPCKYCFAYFVKASLWKHSCALAPEYTGGDKKKKRLYNIGASMMSTEGSDENDLGFLLQGMRRGATGPDAMNYGLILTSGEHLTRKLGNNKEQHGYIRSHMRHLGRLLIHLRAKTGSQASELHDFIHPTKFRMVVDAAQVCAGFDDASHSYLAPSNAIRSGQLLKKVAQLIVAHALEMANPTTVDASTQFLKLCDLQWSEVVASAHKNLSEISRNGVYFLLLTADVMKLSKCLTEEGKKNAAILNDEQGENKSEAYTELTQFTLAKLICLTRNDRGMLQN